MALQCCSELVLIFCFPLHEDTQYIGYIHVTHNDRQTPKVKIFELLTPSCYCSQILQTCCSPQSIDFRNAKIHTKVLYCTYN